MAEERIGVYICHCGTNISKIVDVEAVAAWAGELPGVELARAYKYMCSNPGQEMIQQDIAEHKLTRVVVASCSPRMHEATFRAALERSGVNAYMLDMANIREQCSWIHEDTTAATEKAKRLVHAAVERVKYQEELQSRTAEMRPATLILGGGVAGMTAALELAEAGQQVFLVEKQGELGGNAARLHLTTPYLDSARDLVDSLKARVAQHRKISVYLNAELTELKGFNGNFNPVLHTADQARIELEVGSVLVCTGFQEFDAAKLANYGYGKLPNVITSFEFEAMLRTGRVETKAGKTPRYVSIVHCAGSRSHEQHGYCSRVCCSTALKYAVAVKSALPGAHVANLYTDMESFGKGCEEFYKRAAEQKTAFLMFSKEERPSIRLAEKKDGAEMIVSIKEKLTGQEIEQPADLVVLMVAMEPRADSEALARLVNISRDKDGWYIESHPKLDPVATTTDGVYIAGACQFPKDIGESVNQARAATARILSFIAKGKIAVDAVYSQVNERVCAGCKRCISFCPYGAIEFDEKKKTCQVISAVCKACGCCAAGCLSGAIKVRHYTDEQIFAQIEGVL